MEDQARLFLFNLTWDILTREQKIQLHKKFNTERDHSKVCKIADDILRKREFLDKVFENVVVGIRYEFRD